MSGGLQQDRRLYGILSRRQGGGRVLRLTTRDKPSLAGADAALLWRGEVMAGAELDVDLLAEPAATVLGTVSLTQKASVALVAAVRRLTIATLPEWKIAAGDALIAVPLAVLPNYAIHDAVATKANEVAIALTCPALAIGASFTLPVKLIRFT